MQNVSSFLETMKRKYVPSLQKDRGNIVTGYHKGGEQCENFTIQ